jgi:hypothetical protein
LCATWICIVRVFCASITTSSSLHRTATTRTWSPGPRTTISILAFTLILVCLSIGGKSHEELMLEELNINLIFYFSLVFYSSFL